MRRGDTVVRKRDYDVRPTADFEVAQETGSAGLYADDIALARIQPRLEDAPDHPEDLLVLVDSSASTAGYYHRQAAGSKRSSPL